MAPLRTESDDDDACHGWLTPVDPGVNVMFPWRDELRQLVTTDLG